MYPGCLPSIATVVPCCCFRFRLPKVAYDAFCLCLEPFTRPQIALLGSLGCPQTMLKSAWN